MGLYIAGKVLNRDEWCTQASDFLVKVVDEQAEGGYWSENVGPVVNYNFVYLDALGTYYAVTSDSRVLPALTKGSRFHWVFTYPNGHQVETIDERNPYHGRVSTGNVGFTVTDTGRAFLQSQWDNYGWEKLPSDLIASLLLYGQEGPLAELPVSDEGHTLTLTEGDEDRAAVVRDGPWFICFSAYTAPIPKSRWIQDRQNLVSIYHEKVGVFFGGGNTKLQPGWSNFTVGDVSTLRHTAGDTEPEFLPKGELFHVPSVATLIEGPPVGLELTYGPENCKIEIAIVDEKKLEYTIEATSKSKLPVVGHLTLIPAMNESLNHWERQGNYRV